MTFMVMIVFYHFELHLKYFWQTWPDGHGVFVSSCFFPLPRQGIDLVVALRENAIVREYVSNFKMVETGSAIK